MLIEDLIKEYGLWAVFVGVMIEGDLTLLFAGVLAHYGYFSFIDALATGTFGGFVGDTISYVIGYTGKEKIKNSRFYLRAQPRLEKLCARFGLYSVFLVKYVYGLRTASAIFWGFAHMRFRRFAPLTILSCGLWTLILAGSGFFFSGAVTVIIGEVHKIGMILLIAVAVVIFVALTLYLLEIYVVARNVPEMEPAVMPDAIHESLHDQIDVELEEIEKVRHRGA